VEGEGKRSGRLGYGDYAQISLVSHWFGVTRRGKNLITKNIDEK